MKMSACGRAVVTTDVPGCRDAIEPNVTGLLCEVKSSKSLAEQIEKLILDSELRNNMGKAGREKIVKEFDEKIVIEKYLKAIESILK